MAEVEVPKPEEVKEQIHDQFLRIVALTVASYAVILAIASLGGNNAAKETNLNQQQASNQWAYYQAKVIREHAYRAAKLRLEFDLLSLSEERRADAEKLIAKFAEEEKRFGGDKEEIAKDAKRFEKQRDLNLKKDPYFDYAEVLLQIAIVVASVSMLAKSRPVFAVSLVVALLGIFLTFNGYTLWLELPFLHVEDVPAL
jgi:hypothetical protein